MKPYFFHLYLYAGVVKKLIIYGIIAASFSRTTNWISNYSCWFCFVSSKRSSLLFLLVQMFLFILLMKEHLLDMILSMSNICRSLICNLFLFSWKLMELLDVFELFYLFSFFELISLEHLWRLFLLFSISNFLHLELVSVSNFLCVKFYLWLVIKSLE